MFFLASHATDVHMLAWAASVNALQIQETAETLRHDGPLVKRLKELNASLEDAKKVLADVTAGQHKMLDWFAANSIEIAPARRQEHNPHD